MILPSSLVQATAGAILYLAYKVSITRLQYFQFNQVAQGLTHIQFQL